MPDADGSQLKNSHGMPGEDSIVGTGSNARGAELAGKQQAKRGRGRPRMHASVRSVSLAEAQPEAGGKQEVTCAKQGQTTAAADPAVIGTRTRGRPRKVTADTSAANCDELSAKEPEANMPRKRGRPSKAAVGQAAAAKASSKPAPISELGKHAEQQDALAKPPSSAPKGRENAAPYPSAKQDAAAVATETISAATRIPLSPARQQKVPLVPLQQSLEQPCAPAPQPYMEPCAKHICHPGQLF